jgi:hypothetical protein
MEMAKDLSGLIRQQLLSIIRSFEELVRAMASVRQGA